MPNLAVLLEAAIEVEAHGAILLSSVAHFARTGQEYLIKSSIFNLAERVGFELYTPQ